MDCNEKFMREALKEARKAYEKDEIPVGAIIVKDGKIISRAYNSRESSKNAIAHAEVLAIKKACKKLDAWRLLDCEMYVTLEPCPMCAGAILNARINCCYYGAENVNDSDNLIGNIMQNTKLFNHKTKLVYLQNDDCKEILTKFFKQKR